MTQKYTFFYEISPIGLIFIFLWYEYEGTDQAKGTPAF
ncbi:MAG: hypothetical protein K0S33_243 [Bacteroidetes bacterium]|jgi:hypothetical protein|nr:hypothetical protein [Bacteroidota bacterium]